MRRQVALVAWLWPVLAYANPGNEKAAGAEKASDSAPAPQSAPAKPLTPRETLALARDLFRAKNFRDAAEKLGAILFPTEQLALPSDLAEARLLLGVCFVETGRPGEAKDEFRKLLLLEPDKTLDQQSFSKNAIRVFDETKSEVEDEKRKIADRQRIDAIRKAQEDYIKSLRPIEIHSLVENFAPFGGAQFLEHRTGWGVAFFTSQTLTMGVSLGTWLFLVGKYGLQANNVPAQDVTSVRSLQTLEIASGVAFFALYGLGVADSFSHYHARVQLQGDESLLPPEMRVPAKRKKTSLRERIHVFPMATAHGAGIAIGWEN
jgi:tetratricopeptide (TPR) repeat protein